MGGPPVEVPRCGAAPRCQAALCPREPLCGARLEGFEAGAPRRVAKKRFVPGALRPRALLARSLGSRVGSLLAKVPRCKLNVGLFRP